MPEWTPFIHLRPPESIRGPLARRAQRERLAASHQTTHGPSPPVHCPHADIARTEALNVAALLTAAAFGPIGPLSFVAPCNCGLGLYARTHIKPGQFISAYDGPRLPARLQVRGQYVLQVPGTNFVIDGACENSPFECGPRSPAIYANHSRRPNARITTWPVPVALISGVSGNRQPQWPSGPVPSSIMSI